jgi:S1-C subfamily serine protease
LRLGCGLACAILAGCAGSAGLWVPPPLSPEDVAACREDAIVLLRVRSWRLTGEGDREVEGQGVGVLIDPLGRVATTFTTVRRAIDAEAVLSTEARYTVGRLLFRDADFDLAIVELQARDTTFPSVAVEAAEPPPDGRAVFSYSNLGGARHLKPGHVNGTVSGNVHGRPLEVIRHDAVEPEGSSGGILFDDRGDLVGLRPDTVPHDDEVSVAIPVARLAAMQSDAFRVDRDLAAYFDREAAATPERLTEPRSAELALTPGAPWIGLLVVERGHDYVVVTDHPGVGLVLGRAPQPIDRVIDGRTVATVAQGRPEGGGWILAFTAERTEELLLAAVNVGREAVTARVSVSEVRW